MEGGREHIFFGNLHEAAVRGARLEHDETFVERGAGFRGGVGGVSPAEDGAVEGLDAREGEAWDLRPGYGVELERGDVSSSVAGCRDRVGRLRRKELTLVA
jgi:hypothetical protein